MNKEVLIALIAKDVRELQIMTEGMDKMQTIPSQYLHLAHNKSKELTENIDNLIKYLETQETANAQQESERKAEEMRQHEAAKIEEQKRLEKEAEERKRREEEQIARETKEREQEEQRIAAEKELQEQKEREDAERRRAEEERQKLEKERREREIEEERARQEEDRKAREEKLRQAEEEFKRAQREIAIHTETVVAETTTTLAESIKTSESIMDKLSKKEDNTIASAINNQKINDLKTAFSIADRFRFQRELFAGDGEEMNKALSEFNSFTNIEEAIRYINNNFDWEEDNSAVADFMQLLHRRYL